MIRGKLLALALVGVIGTGALAAGGKTGFGSGKWADGPLGKLLGGQIGRMMVLRSELNVTDEQKEKIHAIIAGKKKEILPVAKGVWAKRVALRDAVLADKPDEAAIRKAADELGKAIGDAAVLGAKVVGEVKPVLTAEQRERIKKFHDECESATEKFFVEQLAK